MLVFANGCFDLLHAGHRYYLAQARSMGSALVVGLNSDKSIRRLKGEGRPIQTERERMRALLMLEFVGCVQIFDDDTPLDLVYALRPGVYCCGADHDPEPWRSVLGEWSGVVVQARELPGVRTTTLLRGIRCAF